MKKVATLVIALFAFSYANAQKVYKVDYENQADVKVHVVSSSNQAKKKIYFTRQSNQSDLKIYYVSASNQAEWRSSSKKGLMD